MANGYSNEMIYFYIKRQKTFYDSERKVEKYIYLIGKNNFLKRVPFNAKTTGEMGVSVRSDSDQQDGLAQIYILICSHKTKRDPMIEKYISQIRKVYPVVKTVERMFEELHALIIGNDKSKLDKY